MSKRKPESTEPSTDPFTLPVACAALWPPVVLLAYFVKALRPGLMTLLGLE